ncbi:MAG TPA: hypothetical protein VL947_09180, partial [Cytophagales bacterium]|nr:hypothetical protein [Cytophagales bacterium]
YTTSYVEIQVLNPVYEHVKVCAAVKFQNKIEEGVSLISLYKDLEAYICPWSVDHGLELSLGGSINLDQTIHFISSRHYVSYVTHTSMLVLHDHGRTYDISDTEGVLLKDKTLYASTPWTVLVPMKVHAIKVIEDDLYRAPEKAAIENLRIGSEFVVVAPHGKKLKEVPTSAPRVDMGTVRIDIDL